MQKSKLQNILFTIVMAFVMVYAMVCYNIALDKGQMSNEIFFIAFHEIPIMWPIACILEYFVVEKLAAKLAFRFVSPQDKPIFITLAISSMIVCLMCPTMMLYCNPAVHESGKRDHRAVAAEVGAEFPDGTLLADFLCRTGCAEFLPAV